MNLLSAVVCKLYEFNGYLYFLDKHFLDEINGRRIWLLEAGKLINNLRNSNHKVIV